MPLSSLYFLRYSKVGWNISTTWLWCRLQMFWWGVLMAPVLYPTLTVALSTAAACFLGTHFELFTEWRCWKRWINPGLLSSTRTSTVFTSDGLMKHSQNAEVCVCAACCLWLCPAYVQHPGNSSQYSCLLSVAFTVRMLLWETTEVTWLWWFIHSAGVCRMRPSLHLVVEVCSSPVKWRTCQTCLTRLYMTAVL